VVAGAQNAYSGARQADPASATAAARKADQVRPAKSKTASSSAFQASEVSRRSTASAHTSDHAAAQRKLMTINGHFRINCTPY